MGPANRPMDEMGRSVEGLAWKERYSRWPKESREGYWDSLVLRGKC